jgi:leucyl-tRNA synthetase
MEFYNLITEWQAPASGHAGDGGAKPDDGEAGALAEALRTLLVLLSPFAPHIAEELWQRLGHPASIFAERWPDADPRWLKADLVTIILQINGKLRSQLQVPPELDEREIETRALADPKLQPWIEGKTIRKRIYVPGRLLNLVV